MGKGGRIACIFLPYLLTVAALICLIFVQLGSQNTSDVLSDIYFFRADLKDLNPGPDNLPDDLKAIGMGLDAADGKGEIHDFYTIGLWNYCYGDHKDGDYKVTHCTDRQQKFWFNPAEAWGFDDTVEKLYPKSLQKGLDTYEKVAGWMFIAYAVALASNVVQLVVGISAIFSRWGSFATTIIAMVSVVFTVAASATASALFGILVGALKTGLKPFDIHADMGSRMFAATWLASAFSVAGGLFWLFSVCCCSGRSPFSHDDRKGRRGIIAEKAPYTYERVASPYQAHPGAPAGSSVPMHNMPPQDSAYEPYRHEQRV